MKQVKLILAAMAILCLAACGPEKKSGSSGSSLKAPEGVKLNSTTSEGFVFKWNKVDAALSYDWQLLNGGNSQVKNGNETRMYVTVSGIESGVQYYFRVRSVGENGVSDWSEKIPAMLEGGSDPGTDPDPADEETYALFKIPAAEDEDALLRAFPGAEGCGMFTTGGRGGKVLHVTSLADSGQGSLRWAVSEQSGARTVVFDVAGVIHLKDKLVIKNDSLTIAGQTAPGDGICIADWSVQNEADNVIIRFMRFRMGDVAAKAYKDAMTDAQWQALVNSSSPSLPMEDAIWGRNHSDIILDHCSMSWCIDECASFYDNTNFTMQYCILAESLNNSYHPKGAHGYGGIWGGQGASFSHNLIAHHTSRTPRLCGSRYTGQPAKEKTEVVNNVFYNWKGNGGYAGEGGSFNFIGNYYKPGPATCDRTQVVNRIFAPDPDDGKNNNTKGTWGTFHLSGNVFDTGCSALSSSQKSLCNNVNSDNWVGLQPSSTPSVEIKSETAFDISVNGSSVKKQLAADAYAKVLSLAGASLVRDAVDERVVSEVRNGTAAAGSKGLIDSQTQVGGWPSYSASEEQISALKDSDGDGIPDAWEDQFGLSKFNPSDGAKISLDLGKRYTNLEMYLHWLVKDIITGQ